MRMTPLWYREIISNSPSGSRPPPFSKARKVRVFSLALFGKARSWFVESLQLMTHSPHLNDMGKSQQNPSGWVPWILVRFSLKWMYQLQCSWKETLFVYLPYDSPPKKKTTPRNGMNTIMTHFHLKCSLLVAGTLVTRYEIRVYHVHHVHHVYHVYMYVFMYIVYIYIYMYMYICSICPHCHSWSKRLEWKSQSVRIACYLAGLKPQNLNWAKGLTRCTGTATKHQSGSGLS